MATFFKIILLFPGTLLHEFLHFIVGLLLNAKPIGFSLIPKKHNKKYVLGSVTFKNITFYNAMPVAIAPFLGVIPAIYLFSIIQYQDTITLQIFYVYLIWCFVKCSLPSSQDIKVMFTFPSGIIFYGILTYIAYNIFLDKYM